MRLIRKANEELKSVWTELKLYIYHYHETL
jgi:hypothetical protein